MGVILLHIKLNDSLPVSKAAQNRGVYLTCIPHPPLDPKADPKTAASTSVAFFIKVKTEDTEQLFDNLVKFKSNEWNDLKINSCFCSDISSNELSIAFNEF